MLFYRRSLFDEAGLAYPPHKYGDKYTMPDGSVVDWNYDTIAKMAKILTVDKNGKDATQDGFDPEKIVQWGFEPQRDDLRGLGAYFGAGQLAGGGRQDRPDPRALEGGLEVLVRRDLDRPHEHDRAAVPEPGHQPRRTTRSSPATSR